MVKVENQDTLRLLTKTFIKVNKGRNFIIVLAIILTTTLFTTVFTASFSLVKSQRETDMRNYMMTSHAGGSDLTKGEFDRALAAIMQEEEVARVGSGVFLGCALNKELIYQTEVRYGDANLAESFLCGPIIGKMPEKGNEIACSTLTLDALNIPYQLGTPVTLTLEGVNQNYTETFQLVGYWEGDPAVIAQLVWVSKDYQKKVVHPVTEDEIENGIYQGSYEIVVWFQNTWNLEEKTEVLKKTVDLSPKRTFEANSAYLLFEEDGFSFLSLFMLLFLILFAAYLIIYNVFEISVNLDIKIYGLLKNIGTTGRQLKKIIRMQALWLCAIGIPAGLVIGYGVGSSMLPYLVTDSLDKTDRIISLSFNPLIFLGAALFSMFAVYLGCLKPCRLVAKVSPIEALKIDFQEQTKRAKKKNFGVSPWQMAITNIKRNWKKGLIVMLSIALSLITFNGVIILVKGYQFEAYVSWQIESDFMLSKIRSSGNASNLQGIEPKIKEILEECKDIESNGYIYYTDTMLSMDQVLLERCQNIYNKIKKDVSKKERQIWQETLKKGTLKLHLIGINEGIFDKLEFNGKSCTWEEFQNGNQVLIEYISEERFYKENDFITMEYFNKDKKEYQVLGEVYIPYCLNYPWWDTVYLTILLPEAEYIKYTGNENAMRATIDAFEGKEKEVDSYIKENIIEKENFFTFDSILELKKAFQDYLNQYYWIGGLLALSLGVIGVINFFNTSATSILARKKELSLLEVVGMTKKQVKIMLIAEGCVYLIGAFLLTVIIIQFGIETLLSYIVGLPWYFELNITLLPSFLLLPLLLLIAYLIPSYHYKKMKQKSIVERIHNEV